LAISWRRDWADRDLHRLPFGKPQVFLQRNGLAVNYTVHNSGHDSISSDW
jgi:hypothetical protein